MSNGGVPPFIHTNATTTDPSFLPAALTSSPLLHAKTPLVVLTESPGDDALAHVSARVARHRATTAETCTAGRLAMGLRGQGPEEVLGPSVPALRRPAERGGGCHVFTMQPMRPEQAMRLRDLMPLLC